MLGLTKVKTFGIAIGILLVILLFLGWQYRAEVRKSAQLLSNNVQLTQVNKDNMEAINQLREEKAKLERTLEQRKEAQRLIEKQSRDRVKEIERELSVLRGQYEDVEKFMSLPVPDALVEWMRKRQAYSSADRNSEGEASHEPSTANN